MKINIYRLQEILLEILQKKGLSQDEAIIIAHDYWDAEICGKKTHGIAKFYKELPFFDERQGPPQIILDKESMVLVDANREIGQLAANFCIDILISRTKKTGIACVGMKNAQRYGI